MEEVNKVLALKDKIFKKILSSSEKSFIKEVYYNSFGIRLRNNCGTCLIDAYFELKSLTQENLTKMSDKSFEIKDGEVLTMHGVSESYINRNLTNRGALTMLKLNRGCIKFFTKFPENWQEMAAKFDLRMTEEQADEIVSGTKSNTIDRLPSSPDALMIELDTMDFGLLKNKAIDLGLQKKDLKGKGRVELVKFVYGKLTK